MAARICYLCIVIVLVNIIVIQSYSFSQTKSIFKSATAIKLPSSSVKLSLKVAKVEKIDPPKKSSPIQFIYKVTKQVKSLLIDAVSSTIAFLVSILVFLRIINPKPPTTTNNNSTTTAVATIIPKKETLESVMQLTPEDPSRFSDTQISVTIAPPANTNSKSTTGIKTLASTTASNEKPTNWVLRKLNEIRSRDTSVLLKSTPLLVSPLVETGGVTPKSIQQRLMESAVPIPVPLPEVVSTSSSSRIASIKADISAAGKSLSSSPVEPVSVGSVTAAPTPIIIYQSSKPTASLEERGRELSKSIYNDEKAVYRPTVYGPVDSNAVNVNITPELFKLPTINIEGADEWIKAGKTVKDAGISGAIAYAISEVGFWVISFPIIYASYHTTTGAWLSLANPEDRAIILGLSAGFVSAARLALPIRFAAAVVMIPTVDKYITKPFIKKEANNSTILK